MKQIKQHTTRNVGPTITLSDEFKRENYTETILRLYANGLASKETTKTMLARVENLLGEGSA